MVEQSRYKKIVVPLDGSGWSERAIPHASDIAKDNNAEIILLHVYTAPAQEYLPEVTLANKTEVPDTKREEMSQRLIGIRSELRSQGIECRIQFIEGTGPAHHICDYVNSENVDLVVMTTHGRTGLARFLFGNVANRIMQGVMVPVLLIRPDQE